MATASIKFKQRLMRASSNSSNSNNNSSSSRQQQHKLISCHSRSEDDPGRAMLNTPQQPVTSSVRRSHQHKQREEHQLGWLLVGESLMRLLVHIYLCLEMYSCLVMFYNILKHVDDMHDLKNVIQYEYLQILVMLSCFEATKIPVKHIQHIFSKFLYDKGSR